MTGNRNAIRLDRAKLFDMTMMDSPFFLARNNHQQTFTPPHQQETRSVTQCSLFRRTPKIEHLKKERLLLFIMNLPRLLPYGPDQDTTTQQHLQ
ncbi:hypothetical protein CEXT_67161 [Caerostris extrusa]|uniref:Uncharacterized protein n=1 Tax=Caerostris extrusa TaxID=172846 RepID=A0AAV4XZ68_CAEEX|nr:hypothetical protein CEXT_67161 [Caerostris extrusa]